MDAQEEKLFLQQLAAGQQDWEHDGSSASGSEESPKQGRGPRPSQAWSRPRPSRPQHAAYGSLARSSLQCPQPQGWACQSSHAASVRAMSLGKAQLTLQYPVIPRLRCSRGNWPLLAQLGRSAGSISTRNGIRSPSAAQIVRTRPCRWQAGFVRPLPKKEDQQGSAQKVEEGSELSCRNPGLGPASPQP